MQKIIIFGATGMVGQGTLRECLLDPDVSLVQTIGRTPSGQSDPKLKELLHNDLWNYTTIEEQLKGFDACFFCLGTPSSGKTPEEYERVTFGLTTQAAETLARLNPQMTFVYISGDGADSSEQGPLKWARVRGKTENALFKMPFKAVYVFRPAIIQPLHGIQSKTTLYRLFYKVTMPILPALRALFPSMMTTTEEIGRALLAVSRKGYEKNILTSADIAKAAKK